MTPYDKGLFRMVENLTEMPCEPKKSPKGYFIEADYSKHKDPDYINALYEAIEGRAGERLKEKLRYIYELGLKARKED